MRSIAYRVIDTVIMGNKPLWAALEERERIYEKPEMTDEDGSRLGELEGIVGEEDGYEAEANAAILLQGLDIADELHERKMSELQGGQKVRVLLAQALFGEPQALLLDEPTNYLDLDSILWLQDFLVRYNGTLITISHDRHFLNSVCTHIADIDYETIILYNGGYDDMVEQKTAIRSRIESQNEQREKKIAQLNDFIARFSAGTRSSQVNSRKKEVERLAVTELARSNIQRPYIRFEQKRPSGKHILEIEEVSKAYEQKDGSPLQVIDKFSASCLRGDKIVLMGRNGQGKTTMLKALLANAPGVDEMDVSIDSGVVKWGHEAQIGYFPQDLKASIELGHDRERLAAPVRRGCDQGGHPRDTGADALPRRRRPEDDGRALRRRGGAAAVLQADAAEAERAGAGRAVEPPGSGSHQCAQPGAAEVRGHRAAGDPRSGPDRRGCNAHLAL